MQPYRSGGGEAATLLPQGAGTVSEPLLLVSVIHSRSTGLGLWAWRGGVKPTCGVCGSAARQATAAAAAEPPLRQGACMGGALAVIHIGAKKRLPYRVGALEGL